MPESTNASETSAPSAPPAPPAPPPPAPEFRYGAEHGVLLAGKSPLEAAQLVSGMERELRALAGVGATPPTPPIQ